MGGQLHAPVALSPGNTRYLLYRYLISSRQIRPVIDSPRWTLVALVWTPLFIDSLFRDLNFLVSIFYIFQVKVQLISKWMVNYIVTCCMDCWFWYWHEIRYKWEIKQETSCLIAFKGEVMGLHIVTDRNVRGLELLIVATIYLQLIQNRYMFRSFTVLQCSHQHCVQPVASDVEVVGYL